MTGPDDRSRRDDESRVGATGGSTDRPPARRDVLAAAGAFGTALAAGCLGGGSDPAATDDGSAGGDTTAAAGSGTDAGATATSTADTPETTASGAMDGTPTDGAGGTTAGSAGTAWRTTELTAVRTGETFTVGGFDGPVVLETFAVWCPVCERQQEQLRGLTDDATVVSLNVDPNEDAERVASHADDNGFDWRFAVAPADMTRSLVDAFGTAVTNPPAAPVIVDCGSEATLLSGEVNSASELAAEVDEC